MTVHHRLRGCSLFTDIDAHDIESLIKKSKVYEWKSGQRILQESEPVLEFSILIEGRANVYKNLNTKLMVVRELKRSDFYGDFVLSGVHESPFEIFAKTNVEEVKILVDDFYDWLAKRPSSGIQFMVNLLKEVQQINSQSLGLIARLYRDHKVPIGFPLFGNAPLSPEEARAKRIQKMQMQLQQLKFKKSA
ncbi:MAG: hypothetical protein Fur0010_13450 [Bdellovibrio sp.]